jgi:hypothetical protein
MTYSVDVVSQEGSLDSTKHGVDDDTNRKEETSSSGRHASQGMDHSGTTSEQHGSDQDVGHETENNVDNVSDGSISSPNHLKESVGWLMWSENEETRHVE